MDTLQRLYYTGRANRMDGLSLGRGTNARANGIKLKRCKKMTEIKKINPIKAEQNAAFTKAFLAQYKGKTYLDGITDPVVVYLAPTEKEKAHTFRRVIDARKLMDDETRAKANTLFGGIVATVCAMATYADGDDLRLKHRDKLVAQLKEFCDALAIPYKRINKQDAKTIYAGLTSVKFDKENRRADVLVKQSFPIVQAWATNKIHDYDARVMRGKAVVVLDTDATEKKETNEKATPAA